MAAYTTIDDPSAHFQVLTYTGNSSSPRDLVNDGNSDLQPDLVWVKGRSHTDIHLAYDSSRGGGNFLRPASTAAENTGGFGVTAFNSDGFRTNAYTYTNENTHTYVAWQWKVNGGTTSSNTDGDLTSTVQVNQTAGISIFTYTGKDPIEPLDIGHGLGSVPDMFIIKRRNGGSRNWGVYHKDMNATPQNGYIRLNSDNPYAAASTWWRNEAPTSTIIKTGEQADVNQPNDTFVGYAFKSIQGYSKFGKYIGNGSTTNGPFIYTGFQPAFVMIKAIDATKNWVMFDNERNFNGDMQYLYANTDGAEGESPSSGAHIDLLSNGFKIYDNWTLTNQNTVNYVYMAFAQHPFVTSTGIPTTAR